MAQLVVVGAGPAGMAAAIEAANSGIDVVVIDEQARAGGQIFRRPPASFGGTPHYGPYSWAAGLIDQFECHPRISARFRSTALGILRDRDADGMHLQVAVSAPTGGETIHADRVLIATGAYDMPVAFPGWTTPGVMTVGAAQSLLKSQKVLAGQRILLAGSHPLLLIAAEQLIDAGADIVEIAFARGLPGLTEMVGALPAAPGHLPVFVEAARSLSKLMLRGVKISTRTIITEAIGTQEVTGAKLARVDKNWLPCAEPREIEADLILLGYGFSPSTELARQAGCDMAWDSQLGGWVVKHDDSFATSQAGIYVAGEPTGVSGAEQSWAEGAHVGLHIAASLGADPSALADPIKKSERRLVRAARFSKVVQTMFEPRRESLAAAANPSTTVICRCELVTTAQADEVLKKNPFIEAVSAMKLECRSGMGPCQGRYCEGTVAARVAAARNTSIEAVGRFTAHFPVKPVPLSHFCGMGPDNDAPASSEKSG